MANMSNNPFGLVLAASTPQTQPDNPWPPTVFVGWTPRTDMRNENFWLNKDFKTLNNVLKDSTGDVAGNLDAFVSEYESKVGFRGNLACKEWLKDKASEIIEQKLSADEALSRQRVLFATTGVPGYVDDAGLLRECFCFKHAYDGRKIETVLAKTASSDLLIKPTNRDGVVDVIRRINSGEFKEIHVELGGRATSEQGLSNRALLKLISGAGELEREFGSLGIPSTKGQWIHALSDFVDTKTTGKTTARSARCALEFFFLSKKDDEILSFREVLETVAKSYRDFVNLEDSFDTAHKICMEAQLTEQIWGTLCGEIDKSGFPSDPILTTFLPQFRVRIKEELKKAKEEEERKQAQEKRKRDNVPSSPQTTMGFPLIGFSQPNVNTPIEMTNLHIPTSPVTFNGVATGRRFSAPVVRLYHDPTTGQILIADDSVGSSMITPCVPQIGRAQGSVSSAVVATPQPGVNFMPLVPPVRSQHVGRRASVGGVPFNGLDQNNSQNVGDQSANQGPFYGVSGWGMFQHR